MEDVHSF